MMHRLLPILSLALALAPAALAAQEKEVATCLSGDRMPIAALPEEGATLPSPTPSGAPPVPIPNVCQSSGRVMVRGTAQAGPEPLYVVDGVIRPRAENGESPLKSIPAHGIEAITILKDGSGVARYGAQAQHGVVIIQTRTEQAAPRQ